MLEAEVSEMRKCGLTIALDVNQDQVRVGLAGSCDGNTLRCLPCFLNSFHEEVQKVCAGEVIVDCENLYFMSSAAIKCFLSWIAKLKELPANRRYLVVFRINKRLAWQERSFAAICRFAPLSARLG